jgi:uncharacterized OB-fold protein
VEIVKNVKRTCYVPYHWCYGYYNTLFFERLKEEKVIYGSRCTSCGKVVVPTTAVCARCFAPTEKDPVPVSDEGYIDSFTIVYLPYPGQPSTPPYAYGMIKLDGTSNLFMHMIGGVPLEEIKVGMRVKAVWNEERRGDFYDIKYFQPVKD